MQVGAGEAGSTSSNAAQQWKSSEDFEGARTDGRRVQGSEDERGRTRAEAHQARTEYILMLTFY